MDNENNPVDTVGFVPYFEASREESTDKQAVVRLVTAAEHGANTLVVGAPVLVDRERVANMTPLKAYEVYCGAWRRNHDWVSRIDFAQKLIDVVVTDTANRKAANTPRPDVAQVKEADLATRIVVTGVNSTRHFGRVFTITKQVLSRDMCHLSDRRVVEAVDLGAYNIQMGTGKEEVLRLLAEPAKPYADMVYNAASISRGLAAVTLIKEI